MRKVFEQTQDGFEERIDLVPCLAFVIWFCSHLAHLASVFCEVLLVSEWMALKRNERSRRGEERESSQSMGLSG